MCIHIEHNAGSFLETYVAVEIFLFENCRHILNNYKLRDYVWELSGAIAIRWRHNQRYDVLNHRRPDCLFNRLLGADQRKHQSTASLVLVSGIYRWTVDSSHKGPVTQKMIPFDDVIMNLLSVRCIEFQNDMKTDTEVMDKRNFVTFEFKMRFLRHILRSAVYVAIIPCLYVAGEGAILWMKFWFDAVFWNRICGPCY